MIHTVQELSPPRADALPVLAALSPADLQDFGLSPVPSTPATASATAAPHDRWTGTVGVVGTGHMAGGIVEAIARSGREVRVLARSATSGEGLLRRSAVSLDRATSRGRLDDDDAIEIRGRVSVTDEPGELAGTDVNDAVRLHERGVPAAEVDELLRAGAGHPMGPLALVDLIGLDVTIAALDSMAAVEDDPRLQPAAALRELAASGRLGRTASAGFHPYS